ncbi:arginyltransferase [Campylobacter iguaniorum]|uniref:arginyltransferase n=1 Tax=Campylobacter iguaniorum TaxID=1244531 RepID=UPI0007C960A3|nr:arginyltransferase [Campylobacter iguaniorum]ANE35968.1 arginyltransferase [Campylobacter iguaniorum]
MTEVGFCTLDTLCPYLKDRDSRTRYRYIDDCTFSYNSELIKRGYRRFGNYFSKPICHGCDECKSIRIDAPNFKFSKSHKRVINKNVGTRIEISKPKVDTERLNLYTKYHKFMQEKRDWEFHELDFKRYYNVYVEGAGEFGYEVDYFVNETLVCVDLIDIGDDGISSVYCYWDPDFAYLSLGKFSLLMQINMACLSNLKWIYLGFYVKDCESLRYKDEYKPYQTLKTYCKIDENPVWLDSLE